jgi:hypothetical protein
MDLDDFVIRHSLVDLFPALRLNPFILMKVALCTKSYLVSLGNQYTSSNVMEGKQFVKCTSHCIYINS